MTERGGPAPVDDITVRPYRPSDRAAVRHICFVTGYMGRPVAWQWRDAESFADLFSAYYTDEEPGSALVAERRGEVVGYLLGCRDSSRAPDPAAILRRHILRRGLLVRPGTARVVWRTLGDIAVAASRHRPRRGTDPRWPAHLHIDLLEGARGRGIGAVLVRRWLGSLRADGIAGCHLGTMAENAPAIAFFEATGFTRHGDPIPLPGLRSPEGGRHHVQRMVQPLGPPPSG
jgi:ribosomal protein S18 acetylase RimI-like enzyme